MRRSCTLLFLLGFALPGFGQSNYAVLTGTVTDSQHLPVAGAVVELVAEGTGAIRRVVTNQQGLFEAPALLPDDYGTVYEFHRNGALDATTFESMGNNHMVQNDFGASLGGPLFGKKTFFFVNYEGLRLAQADAQILTVPTQAEIKGDFSMSSAKIYDPTTAVANPNYNPSLPTGPSNFPYTRSQFPNNQIPSGRINPLLESFLLQYLPGPNMMMAAGAADSNNYLDVRNETHIQDQGTFRVDHNFSRVQDRIWLQRW